jgi:hypothetical protein
MRIRRCFLDFCVRLASVRSALLPRLPSKSGQTFLPISGWMAGIIFMTSASASAQIQFPLALDGLSGDVIYLFGGPPNTTFTYTVSHTNAAVLGLSLSQSGPWTETLTIPVTTDSTGFGESNPFYVVGEALGSSLLSACRPGPICTNQVNYTVVTVSSVEFIDLDSATDTNPNAGGGRRMYPDKQSTGDTTDRRLIRVRATLTSPVEGITVYFKSFDLDDPSTNASPIDTNGSSGNDNRGSPQNGSIRSASGGSFTSGTLQLFSSPAGIAQADLRVTLHPGDNFGVGTAVRGAVISSLSVDGTSINDAQGNPLPTLRAKATPMLTVWRRLHVETDSMAGVQNNLLSGTIALATYNASLNQTTVVPDLGVLPLESGRF